MHLLFKLRIQMILRTEPVYSIVYRLVRNIMRYFPLRYK